MKVLMITLLTLVLFGTTPHIVMDADASPCARNPSYCRDGR